MFLIRLRILDITLHTEQSLICYKNNFNTEQYAEDILNKHRASLVKGESLYSAKSSQTVGQKASHHASHRGRHFAFTLVCSQCGLRQRRGSCFCDFSFTHRKFLYRYISTNCNNKIKRFQFIIVCSCKLFSCGYFKIFS